MSTLLRNKNQIARKRYKCDACLEWLRSGYTEDDCDTAEQRKIIRDAYEDKWCILPGQEYKKIVFVEWGEFYVLRYRLDMLALIEELDMWDEYSDLRFNIK